MAGVITRRLSHQHAFTLVEVLLVLAVASVFVMLALNRYHDTLRAHNVAAIHSNIQLLQQALNNYYHTHCSDDHFNVAITDLTLTSALQPATIVDTTQNWQGYGVQALLLPSAATGPWRYQLIVSVALNISSVANLRWYENALHATSRSQQLLNFQQLPSLSIPATDDHLWIATAGLHRFSQMLRTQEVCAP